jgi:hypothetical protein
MSTEAADAASLQEALHRCRLELTAARERDEVLSENEAEQLAELARRLDAHLTRAERSPTGMRGWVKRRLLRNVATPEETADAKELRRSRLFDGVWYLSTYPEVAETGLSPALHYLRHGAQEGKDPGPEFSTKHYVARHPLIRRTGVNPLLNHLRTGQ